VVKDFMFESLPYEPRKIEATEAVLERIYLAARKGLRGDTLAYAAGMTPTEYRRLVQFDPIAEYAEQKGRAENEAELAQVMQTAALDGDTKAAMDLLRHVHKWSAPQSVQIQVDQKISITHALEQAKARIIDGFVLDSAEAADGETSDGLLTNRETDGSYDTNYRTRSPASTEL
jgi:hypothetical protein